MPVAVLFLSDYGLDDEFVGACHAVMAAEAPDVRVIDLTHGIPPQDVLRGALALEAVAPYAPAGSVFLAVVDPGVGTERRPVVVEAAGGLLVGPDNGLLSLGAEALGGVRRAFLIERIALPEVSATFHGRDLFAPAAARLAAGMPVEEVGSPVDPDTLVRLRRPAAEVRADGLHAEVIGVDRFGNVQLGARADDLTAAGLDRASRLELRMEGRGVEVVPVRTFGDLGAGQVGLLADSSGWLAVAMAGERAAARLGLRSGEGVLISLPAWDSAS